MTSHLGYSVCAICGQSHEGLPTDTAFTLPDSVWALPADERADRAQWNSDVCKMDEEFFIRCLLEIPFTDQSGYYGWGAWVQVDRAEFERYVESYDRDGTNELPIAGTLANELPTYVNTLGMPVFVQLRASTDRPAIRLPDGSGHPLALDAKKGMSYARFHEVLVARGLANEL